MEKKSSINIFKVGILTIFTLVAVVILGYVFLKINKAETRANITPKQTPKQSTTQTKKPVRNYQKPVFLKNIKLGDVTTKKYPVGGTVYQNEIYLSYFDSDSIDVLSLDGKKKRNFTVTSNGKKAYPLNLAIIDGKLAITDKMNGFLGFYNLQGKMLDGFYALENNENLKPVGIYAFNKLFYFTDANILGWIALHKEGELITVARYTYPESSLASPQGIVVSKDGRVIITDDHLAMVKVYNCGGWYVYDFEQGKGENQLHAPMGLAIDGMDRVHVVDNKANKVFVYDNFGKFLFTYGEGLNGATGIIVDLSKKLIFLLNTEAQALSVWSY